MDYSTPGFPVQHQIPEFAQAHVHRMPSNHFILCRPLLLSQHQGLFPGVSSSHQFFFGFMKVKVKVKSCPTLCDPVDCSLPGSSVHGILQARILEWVAISFSRGFSQPRDRTRALGADALTSEPPGKPFRFVGLSKPVHSKHYN